MTELERDLANELATVERKIAALHSEMAELLRHRRHFRTIIQRHTGLLPPTILQKRTPVQANPPKAVRNAAVEVLRTEGAPLHYRDLTDRLAARGTSIGGRDRYATLRAHLSHDTRFVSLGAGRWALSVWPDPLRST